MATLLGSLLVKLGLDSGEFTRGLSTSERELKAATKRIEKVGAGMQNLGQNLSLAVTAPLMALGATSIKAAMESRDALGQVNAALASMGNAAGRTTEQLQALAAGQMAKSLYDDDEILRSVTANLLTFGNVSGQVFDQAQQAALDLSARLGTDLQGSAIMLGKALNDPLKGVTALTRVGVSFTAQQKEQIKAMAEAGNLAGAQKLILDELAKQYGGAAQAARDNDPFAAMKQSFAEFQEGVGAQLLQAMPAITGAITSLLTAFNSLSPEMQQVVVVGGVLAAALGPVLTVVGSLVTIAAPLAGLFTAMGAGGTAAAAGTAAAGAGATTASVGFGALTAAAFPWIALAAGVAAGAVAIYRNWDTITAVFGRVRQAFGQTGAAIADLASRGVATVRNLYNGVKTWLQDKLGAVFDWVNSKIRTVERAFHWMADQVVFNSHVPDMVDQIGAHMARLKGLMVEPAERAAQGVNDAMKAMADRQTALLKRLFPEMQRLLDYQADMAAIDASKWGDDVKRDARNRRRDEEWGALPGPDFSDVPTGAMSAEELQRALEEIAGQTERTADRTGIATVRIAESFKDMATKALDQIRGLADAIKKGDFLGILEGVLGVLTQLGSAGVFGKKAQININKPIPGYAGGTGYHPGGLALVGERGPELVDLPRGSSVFTNAESRALAGRGSVAQIVPSPYFDVVVDGRVLRAAPSIAQGGAMLAGHDAQFARSRSLG